MMQFSADILDFELLSKNSFSRDYRSAHPFPHIVIDDCWERSFLHQVANEVENKTEWEIEKAFYGAVAKRAETRPNFFPPFTFRLAQTLNSADFIRLLEEITGERDLIADPLFTGGGIHSTVKGGFLRSHVDFNWLETLQAFRRLNCIVYLNEHWRSDYGGDLELSTYRSGSLHIEKTIPPVFNRMVIFTTNEMSYHGHPTPLNCPVGKSRNSFATYYYVSKQTKKTKFEKRTDTLYRSSSGSKLNPAGAKHLIDRLKKYVKFWV